MALLHWMALQGCSVWDQGEHLQKVEDRLWIKVMTNKIRRKIEESRMRMRLTRVTMIGISKVLSDLTWEVRTMRTATRYRAKKPKIMEKQARKEKKGKRQ